MKITIDLGMLHNEVKRLQVALSQNKGLFDGLNTFPARPHTTKSGEL